MRKEDMICKNCIYSHQTPEADHENVVECRRHSSNGSFFYKAFSYWCGEGKWQKYIECFEYGDIGIYSWGDWDTDDIKPIEE